MPMAVSKAIKIYYWATPAFIFLNVVFSLELRVQLPDGYSALTIPYLLASFLLGSFVFTSKFSSAIFAMAESALSLFFLMLEIWLLTINRVENIESGAPFSFGLEPLLNFVIVGSVLLLGFYANMFASKNIEP